MTDTTLTPYQLTELRDLATRLAQEAGDLVRSGRPDRVEVAGTKSSPVDVVTAMDGASERLLRGGIAAARPEDGVLGEEFGARSGSSGLTWVIDPVDGTVNYLYGISSHAVSVAVVSGEPDPAGWTIEAGAVHSVVDGRTWSAARGMGADLDGEPLTPPPAPVLGECLVGTGFGYEADRRREQGRVLAGVIGEVRDIRRLGAAAIDLCLVAGGQLDLFYERGLNPWDMAAGALVITESGRGVSGLRGAPAGIRMTVAGPVERMAEFVELLEAAEGAAGVCD